MAKKKKKPKKEKRKKISHNIKLRIAIKKDFIEIDKYIKKGNKNTKVWKMKKGVPYWLFSSKGIVENKNYILDEHTNLDDFANYLNREQVLIPICKFD